MRKLRLGYHKYFESPKNQRQSPRQPQAVIQHNFYDGEQNTVYNDEWEDSCKYTETVIEIGDVLATLIQQDRDQEAQETEAEKNGDNFNE